MPRQKDNLGRRRFASRRFNRSRLTDLLTFKIEPLESRVLLANIVVTTAADTTAVDGLTSLREAIVEANGTGEANTITFGDGSGSGGTDFTDATPDTILLSSGELSITEDVTITGPGAALLTIDAQGGSRIFHVDDSTSANINVEIAALTLTGGSVSGGDGGAIFSRESLTLRDSVVSANTASHSGGGGRGGGIGIYSENFGTTTITGSTISGNSASRGGGIFTLHYGTTTITGSTISGNSASSNAGGILTASRGETSSTTISGSTISGNSAGTDGGGIFSYNDGTTTITGSTISENSASSNAGGILASNASSMTISGSTISGNSAGTNGGGIWYRNYGTSTITGSTISGNSASSYGGGIYSRNVSGTTTITGSTISGNSADLGGGVYSYVDGTTNVTSSIVARNTAGTTGPDVRVGLGSISAMTSLIGDNSGSGLTEAPLGSPDVNGNLIGGATNGVIDPLLGPLADNGGPTQTMALLISSPAIDAGSNPNAEPFDQRGEPFVRELGAGPDMGAFELFDTTPGIRLVDRTLFVFGTEGRDNVRVRLQGDQVRVQARLNLGTPERTNETQSFASGDVDDIDIYLRGERDQATIANRVLIETRVDGGDGDDRIKGGGAADVLLGGAGNDQVRGGNGDDILLGGIGNDRLFGLSGSDILSGNVGDDRLVGGSGSNEDVLIGGVGEDNLNAGAGDDLIVGHQTDTEDDESALRTILEEWVASPTVLPASLGALTEDGVSDVLIGGQGVDLLVSDAADDEIP